jgi:outer membrane lipoprotein-sorting protein
MTILRLGSGIIALSAAGATWAQSSPDPKVGFENDPKARAVYDGMVKAMRGAQSLSFESDYEWEAGGTVLGRVHYKIWLKKPNYCRMEATAATSKDVSGVMVLDGGKIWTYWPNGKMKMPWERSGKRAAEYAQYSRRYYSEQDAPLARHSIGHVATALAPGLSMPIIDPSTFHGYTDSLQPYLDGVRFIEDQTVDGTACTGIEVSFMKYQRSWRMWLSKEDLLPRKLEQTVRVNNEIVMREAWANVKVNPSIDDKLFVWSPPKGWKPYRMPSIEEGLLARGTKAPDFELAGLNGGKIKLSDYRGKIVWLNRWRCG